MKSEMDIARAHDLIVGVLLGEARGVELKGENEMYARAACDALCWVLEHRPEVCSPVFQDNLERMEAAAAARGFVLRRKEGA